MNPQAGAGRTAIVVDGHPLFRVGVASCLRGGGFEIVGKVGTPSEAMALLTRVQADIAIVDLSFSHGSGLDFIQDLRRLHPHMKVLVLTSKNESFHASRAIRSGANGFISKASRPADVLAAVERILGGGVYVSDRMASRIISQMTAKARVPEQGAVDLLTDREVAVLEMIGSGLPARKIAKALNISPKTVDSHRQHIKSKLKLSDAAALSRFALEWVSESGDK